MKAFLAALAVLLAVAISLTVRGGAAAVVVCVVCALLAGLLIGRADRAHRDYLLRIFAGALIARVLVGTMINVAQLQEFFGGDAFTYDYLGGLLVDSWQGHFVQEMEVTEWTRTGAGWGMPYMVAGIYWVVGQNMLAVQYVNSVIGAATAPVIFLCARHIFQNLRVAKVAAIFVAFFPSLILWSSQGLKDGPIVFLLALAMLATLRLGERFSAQYFVVLAVSMLALLSLRFYIFYMLAAAVAGSFLIGMRRLTSQSVLRQFVSVLALGIVMTYFGVLRTASTQLEMFGNLQALQNSRSDLAQSAASGFAKDVDVSTTGGALSTIPVGATYLLFAPFPWQVANLRQSITIPEMVVWWASFPLLVVGIWFTVKYRLRQALPILAFTTMLTLAYSIFQGNVGTAYRQRSQLLVFYFIFVAVGGVLLKERREEQRRSVLAAIARHRGAALVEGQRRYERWKAERGQELDEVAHGLSQRIDF